jgi:4'-phosphopantetheinyl transferase
MDLACTEIWLFDTRRISENHVRAAEAILSPQELARALRFHFEKDRISYLIAHGLARLALAKAANCAAADIEFETEPNGRPYLVGPPHTATLGFSLSHTKSCVGVAISSSGPVGFDVEYVDCGTNISEIAREVFTEREIDALHALDIEERRHRFFQLWTLKEAYLKALGVGLFMKPTLFSFDFEDDRPIFHPSAGDAVPWAFHSIAVKNQHWLAACYPDCGKVVQVSDGRVLLRG